MHRLWADTVPQVKGMVSRQGVTTCNIANSVFQVWVTRSQEACVSLELFSYTAQVTYALIFYTGENRNIGSGLLCKLL